MEKLSPYLRYIARNSNLPNKSFVRAYDCRFFYVLSGRGTFFTENGKFDLLPDTLCYYPSGVAYHIESDREDGLYFVSVNFDFTESYGFHEETFRPVPEREFDERKNRPTHRELSEGLFYTPFALPNASFLRSDFLRLCDINSSSGAYKKEICSAILEIIILSIASHMSNPRVFDSLVDRVMKYIEENYTKPIRVSDIARHFGYHPYYLGCRFKEIMGFSVLEYIRRLRTKRAEELLIHTDDTISVISEKCGFESVDGFTSSFKRQNKMPPTEWRHEYRRMY